MGSIRRAIGVLVAASVVTLAAAAPATNVTCNGVAVGAQRGGYYATNDPNSPGSTGSRYFWTNTLGTVYQDTAMPIAHTSGITAPAVTTTLVPIQ